MGKITITLDGQQREVEDGSLVIDAAKSFGIEVPHYCYHPALGNPGVCRLCMVEVEGMHKMQVSCRLQAKQGMVIKTNSGNARRAQASSLEFHLVNHPLDCPVCDQAGECWLQDYYMRFGLYTSTVKEDKIHKPKRVDIGTHVMLDDERCILCTRCTRFLDNVTKTHELGIFNRGAEDVLMPYPGMRVDNPYSANIVDICPVGALTEKDFRFKVRVWYLEETPSVCNGCARGCSIEVHTNTKRPWHSGGERVVRLKPRHNPEVNGYWICDEGRYGFKSIDAPTRLKAASVMEDGKVRRVLWPEASARIAAELKEFSAAKGSSGLAVVLSGTLSNEDLFYARKLFVDVLKAGHILIRPGPDQLGEEDELLRRREKVPNLAGAEAMGFGSTIRESSWEDIRKGIASGTIWGLYVVDRDPVSVWNGLSSHPAAKGEGTDEGLSRLAFSAFQGTNANHFTDLARWVLPSASYAEEESTFSNFEGHVQRTRAAVAPIGDARSDWEFWWDILRILGHEQPQRTAPAIFDELCKTDAPFRNLSWKTLGQVGKKMNLDGLSLSTLKRPADGSLRNGNQDKAEAVTAAPPPRRESKRGKK